MLAPFPARWTRYRETLSLPALMPGSRSRAPRSRAACPRVTPHSVNDAALSVSRKRGLIPPGVARFKAGRKGRHLDETKCLRSPPVKRGRAVEVPRQSFPSSTKDVIRASKAAVDEYARSLERAWLFEHNTRGRHAEIALAEAQPRRGRAPVQNLKKIKTPDQCYRHCRLTLGADYSLCPKSCY
jgi:hypothetical protein